MEFLNQLYGEKASKWITVWKMLDKTREKTTSLLEFISFVTVYVVRAATFKTFRVVI